MPVVERRLLHLHDLLACVMLHSGRSGSGSSSGGVCECVVWYVCVFWYQLSPSRNTTCCTPTVLTRSMLMGNSRPSSQRNDADQLPVAPPGRRAGQRRARWRSGCSTHVRSGPGLVAAAPHLVECLSLSV